MSTNTKNYEIWRDACGMLTEIYKNAEGNIKDSIMMITSAYDGILHYVNWHKNAFFKDDDIKSEEINTKARYIMSEAVKKLINSTSKAESAAFLLRIISGNINADSRYTNEYYLRLQEDIYDCINSIVYDDKYLYPSVTSFAEFSAFTNIDLDPDTPVEV